MSKNSYPLDHSPSETMMRLVLRRCVKDIATLSGDPERYESGLRSSLIAEVQAAAADDELPWAEALRADVIKELDAFLKIKP